MSQFGVKETKEVLDLALGAVKAGTAIAADKKVDLNDLSHVLALLPVVQPAFDKIDQVPKELSDLDASEAADLVAHVSANLQVTDEKAKIHIAYGLKIVHKAYLIYVDVKDMKAALAQVA
jgi:hypothetical protein